MAALSCGCKPRIRQQETVVEAIALTSRKGLPIPFQPLYLPNLIPKKRDEKLTTETSARG